MNQALEKQTIAKISWRLLPLIVVIYFVAYIDRTNVGFAAIGMNKDLGFTAYIFGWGAGWKWLFVLEAIPSVILAFVVLAVMTDRPALATWLKPEERNWLETELEKERVTLEASHGSLTLFQALTDRRVIALSLIYMTIVTATYGVTFFLPLIGNGAAGGIALVNSIGNLGGFAGPYAVGWLKDSTGTYQAGLYFLAGCAVLSAIIAYFTVHRKPSLNLATQT
jgi:sugar phosphate permease